VNKQNVLYSELELKILSHIKYGSKINTLELVDKIYKENQSINARITIVVAIKRIIEKSKKNNEEWKICKSYQNGNNPIKYWREKRK